MADATRREDEAIGEWLNRVREERYQERAKAKAKAEQEALEFERARAAAVIEGIVPAIERALEEEEKTGRTERIVVAVPGFVKLEDVSPNAWPSTSLEAILRSGENKGPDNVALTPSVFRERNALRMIVAECWQMGLDCWLMREPMTREAAHGTSNDSGYGLAVSPNPGRITHSKARKKTKKE